MSSRAEREQWLAQTIPGFQQTLDENEASRPLQVVAAQRWQPLLQTLLDSGVADVIKAKTGTYEFPELVIQPEAYDFDMAIRPTASVWPRKDEVNMFLLSVQSDEYRGNLLRPGWSVHIIMDHESPSLRLETIHVPDFRNTRDSVYEGHHHSVDFEVDPNKNLRVLGAEEFYNGPIDHLNKRGLQKVRAAINRAFRRPRISESPISIAVLGTA